MKSKYRKMSRISNSYIQLVKNVGCKIKPTRIIYAFKKVDTYEGSRLYVCVMWAETYISRRYLITYVLTQDLMNTSSLLQSVAKIQILPKFYTKMDTYLDLLKKLWVCATYCKESKSYATRESIIYIFTKKNKQGNKFNVFHVRALYYTKTLITNKCTKRVLSSIVTHSYMFRPCWVIFGKNFSLPLH
jgi:hypothetical protein